MSKVITCFITAFLILATTLSYLHAEETELHITVANADRVVDDVDRILALTNKSEQKQREVVRDFLVEYMLPGVDRAFPIKADAITQEDHYRLRLFVPVVKLRTFRKDALGTLDIQSTLPRKNRKAKGPYELKGAFTGFLKYTPPNAIIVENEDDLQPPLLAPEQAFAPFANSELDLIVSLNNPDDGIEQRHTDFGGFRTFFTDYIVRRKEEPAHKFAFRQTLDLQLIEELERLYAESSTLLSTWSLPEDLAAGSFNLDLTPIADSSLAGTINALKDHPSYFAGVPQPEQANLKGRILLPVDEMRKENLHELAAVAKTSFLTEIDKKEERPEAAKEALHKATDLFFGLFLESVDAGWLDGFAHVYDTEAGQTALGGMTSIDGEKAREVLALIPQTKEGRTVEMDVDKQGEISIHKVTFEEGALKTLEQFFGEAKVLYVGTSNEAVWYAAGANAVEEMKTAITQSAEKPAENGPFVDINIKLAPWIETIHKARGEGANSKLFNFAQSSFTDDDDLIKLNLQQVDDSLTGQFTIEKGILRFIGKLIADFSKETLDEE